MVSATVTDPNAAPHPETMVAINDFLRLGWVTRSSQGWNDGEYWPITGRYPKAGNQVPSSPKMIVIEKINNTIFGKMLSLLDAMVTVISQLSAVSACPGLFQGLHPTGVRFQHYL